MRDAASDLGRRALAILVLAIAAWFLLKVVIGVISSIATFVAIVLAVVAIVWALRAL